ncbi:MAG: terminase large subunit [Candidatus Saccharimonadaceae bacterium]
MEERSLINMSKPHQKQQDALLASQKRLVFNWGRRGGKSKLAGDKTAMSAIIDQGNYYIIAPTIGNARKIYWDDILKVIFKDSPLVDKKFVRDVMKRKDWNEVGFNENENSVTIDYIENAKVTLPDGRVITVNHDTKKPRSKIVLYGGTEPDNILGVGLKGAVLDECAKMKNFMYIWQKVVSPMLADYDGWGMFISTPLGTENEWYRFVNRAKANPDRYFFSHLTSYENPYVPNKSIDEQREQYVESHELHVFEQEFLAEFVNPEGAIFPEFDDDVHTFDVRNLPKKGTHILGIDFGMSPDPAAIIGAMIDENNDWWFYDETYQLDLDTDRISNLVKSKMMDTKYERIIGDAQAKDSISVMRRVHRIPIVKGSKGSGSIKDGINLIHGLLRKGPNGQPRMHIANHMINTLKEFHNYSRKRDSQGVFLNIPEDKNNHAIDAIRYMLERLISTEANERKYNTEKKEEAKYSAKTGRRIN